MAGHELLGPIETHPLGIDLEDEPAPGVGRGHGVAIGLEVDPALGAGTHRLDQRAIEGVCGQGQQLGLLVVETIAGPLVGLAMASDIGHGVEPLPGGGVDRGEGAEFAPVEEVFLRIAHAVLDAALLMGFTHPAGLDGEAKMRGQFLVAGMKARWSLVGALQHRPSPKATIQPTNTASWMNLNR